MQGWWYKDVRYKHLVLGIYRKNDIIPGLFWGMQKDVKSEEPASSLLVLLVLGPTTSSFPVTSLERLTKSCLFPLSNVKTCVEMGERRGGATHHMASFHAAETIHLYISSRPEQTHVLSPATGLMGQAGQQKVPLAMGRKPLEEPAVNPQETEGKWSSFLTISRLACTCACIPPRLACKCACIPPSSKILCQAMSLCNPMINTITSRAASEPDNPGFLVCPYLIGNCPFRSTHFLAMSFLSLGPLLTENWRVNGKIPQRHRRKVQRIRNNSRCHYS